MAGWIGDNYRSITPSRYFANCDQKDRIYYKYELSNTGHKGPLHSAARKYRTRWLHGLNRLPLPLKTHSCTVQHLIWPCFHSANMNISWNTTVSLPAKYSTTCEWIQKDVSLLFCVLTDYFSAVTFLKQHQHLKNSLREPVLYWTCLIQRQNSFCLLYMMPVCGDCRVLIKGKKEAT